MEAVQFAECGGPGVAGGVGSAVLQIARHRGIKVIAAASERNQDIRTIRGRPEHGPHRTVNLERIT